MSASEQLHAMAAAIVAGTTTAATAAGAAVRDAALDNARAAAGGDLLLTGKKRRGIPLDVTVADAATPTGAGVTVTGTPVGPWRWIDTGTRPHSIPRRKRGPKARLRVHHPGTAGKGAWSKTVESAPELVRAAGLDAIVTELGTATT